MSRTDSDTYQICWLIVAFVWGILRVYINLHYREIYFMDDTVMLSVDRGGWTFGQIVSVALLAAPLITIIEYFDHGKPHPTYSPYS